MVVGIVSNSDKRKLIDEVKIEKLIRILKENKIDVEVSPYMYEDNFYNKAMIFNEYFKMNLDYIIDVSGGDLANEILNLIDYDAISKSKSIYMGYSDNTCIIDAIYKMSGKQSILYRALNVVYNTKLEEQFISYLLEGKGDLLEVNYRFIKGEELEGTLVGGNIRCLLKLVGLPYLPDFKDKILFLESLGGTETSIRSLFATMMNLNIFNEIGRASCRERV